MFYTRQDLEMSKISKKIAVYLLRKVILKSLESYIWVGGKKDKIIENKLLKREEVLDWTKSHYIQHPAQEWSVKYL